MPGICNCCCTCACVQSHRRLARDRFICKTDENNKLQIVTCNCSCHKYYNELENRRKYFRSTDTYFSYPMKYKQPKVEAYNFRRFSDYDPSDTDINRIEISGVEPFRMGGTRYKKHKVEEDVDPNTGIIHRKQTIQQTVLPHSLLDSTMTRTNHINTYYNPVTGISHRKHTIHKKHHDDGIFSDGGAQQYRTVNTHTDHLTGQIYKQQRISMKNEPFDTVHITHKVPTGYYN